MNTLAKYLEFNTYPGRGIIIGSDSMDNTLIAYFIVRKKAFRKLDPE